MSEKRKLKLSDILCYMPYGLKTLKNGEEILWRFEEGTVEDQVPVLRSMDDIGKSIILEDGREIIPIVELAKIASGSSLRGVWTMDDTFFAAQFGDWGGYLEFRYIPEFNKFELTWNYPDSDGDEINDIQTLEEPWRIYDKLSEWMFDWRLLSEITNVKYGA